MRYPWVNLALLVLLLVQVVSGYFGFTGNRIDRAWILWIHSIGAYGLLLLFGWKAVIIVESLRRRRRAAGERGAFLLLTLLLLLTLVSGLVWSFQGPVYFGGFSLVSLHIYIAVPTLLLWLWHSWRLRWIARVPASRDRRAVLRGLTGVAGGWLLWQLAVAARIAWALPGADRRFTGSYERASFSTDFPSVSWIADRPAPIDTATWTLTVEGAVARRLTFTYADLRALPQQTLTATLDCTGGFYTTQVWRGVRLGDLLAQAGVAPAARSVTLRAVSGYRRRFNLAAAADYLLALEVAAAPLRHGHGAPLRLVAPDRRGVDWVKWIVAVEVNTTDELLQLPLPLQ